jgi:hypothetical protein
MVPELIGKYIFLVQLFVEAGERGLSWREVSGRWEARYGEAYPRRSFLNHRAAVEEVFGLVIVCDRSTNLYKIDSAESAVDKRAAVDYLINTFTVNSLLTLGQERLRGRVSVEDVPSGQKYLTVLMQAMLEGEVLRIRYRKYLSAQADLRTVRPYALREFAKRWYLVAYSEEAAMLRVYALDRLLSVECAGDKFKMPAGFSVEEAFEASYGMYLPEPGQEPVLVKLRTTLREAAYLQDLPLHPSQTLVSQEGDHCLFALRLIPNPNLIMELCKHGAGLEVLEPESLRQAVKETLEKTLQLYEN